MALKSILALRYKQHRILSDNKAARNLAFSALYTAQGIPEGAIFFAIPAWLAMNGQSAIGIASYAGIIILPWTFKLIIAPLMDRYTFLPMGRKRPWVFLGQIGLILSFLSIGFVEDPLNNLSGLMICGFLISCFGAIQDVATDGMAVDVIPPLEQAKVNGLMWGSKTLGISLSLLACTAMINTIGFTVAISMLSLAVATIMLIPILFRERSGEKTMPWSQGKANITAKKTQVRHWKTMLQNLWKVVKLPSSLCFVFILFLSGLIAGWIDTAIPIFTIQELNWTNASYSEFFSAINILSALIGMLIGGYIIDRFGKVKMMIYFMGLTFLSIVIFALLPQFWSVNIFLYAFIFVYYLLYILYTIAMFASAMTLSWKVVAATQFTLYMSISNIGRALGSKLVGTLQSNFVWQNAFLIISLIALAIAVVTYFINLKSHRAKVKLFMNVQTPVVIETI